MKIKFIDILKAILMFIFISTLIIGLYIFTITKNEMDKQSNSNDIDLLNTLETIDKRNEKYAGYAFSAYLDDVEIDSSSTEVFHKDEKGNGYISVVFPYNSEVSFAKITNNEYEFSGDTTFDFREQTETDLFSEYPQTVKNNITQILNSNAFTILDSSNSSLTLMTTSSDVIFSYYPMLLENEVEEGKSIIDLMGNINTTQMSINITFDEDDITIITNVYIVSDEHNMKLIENLAYYSKDETLRDVLKSFEDGFYFAQSTDDEIKEEVDNIDKSEVST